MVGFGNYLRCSDGVESVADLMTEKDFLRRLGFKMVVYQRTWDRTPE